MTLTDASTDKSRLGTADENGNVLRQVEQPADELLVRNQHDDFALDGAVLSDEHEPGVSLGTRRSELPGEL